MTVPQIVAVVGPFRSGTSCIAGMLHTLDVSMGNRFARPKSANPKGFYEAIALKKICIASYKEPLMIERNTRNDRVRLLKNWAYRRRRDGEVIGVKHPTLCLMVPDMEEAWPGVKVVAVDRSMESILASWRRWGFGRKLSEVARRGVLTEILARRDAALESLHIPTLRLDFDKVVSDPAETVSSMIVFAELSPTDDQIHAAIAHVEPSLQHFTKK